MKVVVSAGGRFHALHLAHQLATRSSLHHLFTFDFTGPLTNKQLPPALVTEVTRCKILNEAFVRLRLARLIGSSRFNVFKDNLFDAAVSKRLLTLEPFDLYVGWAHYALASIPAARSRGALVVIESGSCHIKEQQQLLANEYQRWGLTRPPIDPRTIDKMCAEYDQADYIMTLSTFARDSFVRHGIPAHKVLMVPCGADIEYFDRWIPGQARDDKGANQTFRVIFVGLVSLRKGVGYLLEAWRLAQLPADRTELIIVGSQQQDFASVVAQLPIGPNIRFTGPVGREQLKALYNQSSLFVLPSVEDGFGMVIGEAMAAGLPVVCSANSAAPDIIEHGIHGFVVPAGNSAVLAEKIRWCYDHQHEAVAMGMAGNERIKAFSWNVYGQRVYEQYGLILNLPSHNWNNSQRHSDVTPAKAGAQGELNLDPGLRRGDNRLT